MENLINYLGSFVIVLAIYFLWFSGSFSSLLFDSNLITDGIFVIISSLILTSLLMMPIWFASFLVYRKSGHRINYRLDTSRVMITAVFNFFWILLGGGGPIILRLGDIKYTEERAVRNHSFIRGIAFGSIYTVTITVLLAFLSMVILGDFDFFPDFLVQDQAVSVHIIEVFFGATWITLILVLPLGDFYDRVLKQWNIVGYLIMCAVAILILIYSYQVIYNLPLFQLFVISV